MTKKTWQLSCILKMEHLDPDVAGCCTIIRQVKKAWYFISEGGLKWLSDTIMH
jgi:hypothetical protein